MKLLGPLLIRFIMGPNATEITYGLKVSFGSPAISGSLDVASGSCAVCVLQSAIAGPGLLLPLMSVCVSQKLTRSPGEKPGTFVFTHPLEEVIHYDLSALGG